MMEKRISKELAFFSMLETALNLNLQDEKSFFKISFKSLEKKIKMEREEVIQNLKTLEDKDLVKISSITRDKIILDLSTSHTKLSQVFTKAEIEELLHEFDYFIGKYENLILQDKHVKKYVNLTKKRLKKGINVDINDIIKTGIARVFKKNLVIDIEKKLYDICGEGDEKDLEIVEVVLFCMYNFDVSENPFLVTLFLASIYENMN